MPADPKVIAALAAAVEADPESNGLRLHLASLMLDVGDAQRALPHLELVLARDPANVEALLQATRACEALGDPRADGYRQLATALSTGTPQDAPTPTEAAATPAQEATGAAPQKVRRLRVTDAENEEFEEVWEVEKPAVKLADVGGLEHVKQRLNVSFLGPMRNPEIREAFGKSLRGGLLMFGPPGCGKTFIARALAGELDAHFISVGLTEVLDMWLGNSEKNVHAIFELARRHAPTVLFFDEVDAIGRKRVSMTNQAGRNIVNQLLAEMDGADGDNDGVFVLGATNHPWDIDSAMMRPGRFDRLTLVLPPDRPARVAILRHHLARRPVEAFDLGRVADRLEGYSGADIAHLCESAAELAMEQAMRSGEIKPITQAQVLAALKSIQPSTRQWFETARNFAIFANQAGMYDDLLTYMRSRQML